MSLIYYSYRKSRQCFYDSSNSYFKQNKKKPYLKECLIMKSLKVICIQLSQIPFVKYIKLQKNKLIFIMLLSKK